VLFRSVGGGHFLAQSGEWQAASSGTHYLSVSSSNGLAAGAYQITMTETLDDFGNSDEHASPIELDTPVNGRIDYEEDSDYFVFEAVAGHTYAVRTYGQNAGDWHTGADVRARWPEWVETFYESGSGYSQATFTAAYSGPYFIDVQGGMAADYSIDVRETTLLVPPADAISIESDQRQELTVEPGQTVFLRLVTQEGSHYDLDVWDSRMEVPWYVADNSGAIFSGRRTYMSLHYSDANENQPPAPLYLVIKGVEGAATHVSVTLVTYRVNPPAPTPQAPPGNDEPTPDDSDDSTPVPQLPLKDLVGSVSGAIRNEADSGFFTFHAVAGRSYRFRTVLGTLDDSILGLFDPITQKVMAVNDDTDNPEVSNDDVQQVSSEVRWRAEASGDVYLIVYGFDEESTGTYRLEVYSSSAALKEETLTALAVLPARANEMVLAVDDALWEQEDSAAQDSAAWDDSGDLSDDWSDTGEADVWDEADY